MKLFRASTLLAAFLGNLVLAQANPPALVPAPHQVHWSEQAPVLLATGSVAIVLGAKASPPEEQAARLLQEFVSRRHGQQWPVLREGQEESAHTTLILLGQRTTSAKVNELCRQHELELNESHPGFDGYRIESFPEGRRLVVLVAGANARGVVYGQDTLAQLLQPSPQGLTVVRASVQDAPAIPWRGRPQTAVAHYLRPGELDLYLLSRINFIDLRNGIYAFEPGDKLDKNEISEAVKQAHSRGLVIYATVNCGVSRNQYPKVLETFRELLALGADGLWLSFDDKGPGEDPVALTRQVLELGRAHQITNHLIAVTPPKGSYQKIATEFNRKLLAVPGMETATWFWTGVPSAEALAEARSVGLKRKLGWWHNWPRDFTIHAYSGVPPLADGWHGADYDTLNAGSASLDIIMPWGGNSFGQHYIVPTIGWWAWNPAAHDWTAVRQRIASIVFGPDAAPPALKFDDALDKLFAAFHYSSKVSEDSPYCPPRLRNQEAREATRKLAAEMAGLFETLQRQAPTQSLLPPAELEKYYLVPMRTELENHRAAIDLDFPETWWPAQQRRLLEALYSGQATEVNALLAAGRTRVLAEVQRIAAALPRYPHVTEYCDWWRQRASLDTNGWQALLRSRQQRLNKRVTDYSRQIIPAATMLAGAATPPVEWGIGRWQEYNRVLATVSASPNELFWGDWLAGIQEHHGLKAAVFAGERKKPGDVGEYAELSVTVPLAGHRDRLAVLLNVSSANKDLFSNTLVPYRWAGYRFIQLATTEKVLWEADLGQIPEKGEWFLVRLPPTPENVAQLALRLRVEDRKLSLNNYTIAYVSPLTLLELPAESAALGN